jgi:hypothetical protein
MAKEKWVEKAKAQAVLQKTSLSQIVEKLRGENLASLKATPHKPKRA